MLETIEIEASASADIRPEVALLLRGIPQSRSYHDSYRLRHPSAIYHLSLERLVPRFNRVIEDFQSLAVIFTRQSRPPEDFTWLASVEPLLYAVLEHIEDCQNVLLCLFPDAKSAKRDNAFKHYNAEVKRYRKPLAKIVNAIKHGSRHLRPCIMYDSRRVVPGYFVEGMVAADVVGPDPDFHPHGDSAISLWRDRKRLFCTIFLVARKLQKAVECICPGTEPRALEETRFPVSRDYFLLASELSMFPDLVFPNEIHDDVPFVKICEGEQKSSLQIGYQRDVATVTSFSRWRMLVQWGGDGVNRTFKYPYAGQGRSGIRSVRYG